MHIPSVLRLGSFSKVYVRLLIEVSKKLDKIWHLSDTKESEDYFDDKFKYAIDQE